LLFFGKQPLDKTLDLEPVNLDYERYGHEGGYDNLDNVTARTGIDIGISVMREKQGAGGHEQGHFQDMLKKIHLFTSLGSALVPTDGKPGIAKYEYIIFQPQFQP
jgi:hypothetical protein